MIPLPRKNWSSYCVADWHTCLPSQFSLVHFTTVFCILSFSVPAVSQISLTAHTDADKALDNFIGARNVIVTADSAIIDSGYTATFELFDLDSDTANWDLCSYFQVKVIVEDAKTIQKNYDRVQAKNKNEKTGKKRTALAKMKESAAALMSTSTSAIPSASKINYKIAEGEYKIGDRFWHLGKEDFFLTQALCEQNFGLSDVKCDNSQYFDIDRYQRKALKATFTRGLITIRGLMLFEKTNNSYGALPPSAIFVPETSFRVETKARNTSKYLNNIRTKKENLVEDALLKLGTSKPHLFTDSIYVFVRYGSRQASINRVYWDTPSVSEWMITNKREIEDTEWRFLQSIGLKNYLIDGIWISGHAKMGGSLENNFIKEIDNASLKAYDKWKSQPQYRNKDVWNDLELPVMDSWLSVLGIFHSANDQFRVASPEIVTSSDRKDVDDDGTLDDVNRIQIEGFKDIYSGSKEEYLYDSKIFVPGFGDDSPLVNRRIRPNYETWIPVEDSTLSILITENIHYKVKYLFQNQQEVEEMERALKQQEEAQLRWESRLNEIRANGGQKYIDAFERLDIIVGMPKDLTMVLINRFYKIESQSDFGNTKTLVCAGRLDPGHGLWVTFSGNKVSSISTY